MDIYVQKHGEKLGPFSVEQARTRIGTGVIVPDDLASTTGQGPWQPLSAIVDLTAPTFPPVPAVENLAAEPSPVEVSGADEGMLYQDTNKFLDSRPFEDYSIPKSPWVTIIGNQLRVGNNTYLLDGVTSVSLESPLRRIERATLIKRVGLWLVFSFFLAFFLGLYITVGLPRSFSFLDLATIVVFVGIPFVLAMLASKKDIKERYHRAEITLVRAGQPTKVFIGAFRRAPGWISEERDLWVRHVSEVNREKRYKERVDFYNGNILRTEQITSALSTALRSSSTLMSKA